MEISTYTWTCAAILSERIWLKMMKEGKYKMYLYFNEKTSKFSIGDEMEVHGGEWKVIFSTRGGNKDGLKKQIHEILRKLPFLTLSDEAYASMKEVKISSILEMNR